MGNSPLGPKLEPDEEQTADPGNANLEDTDFLRKILKQIQNNVQVALELLEDGSTSKARLSKLLTEPEFQDDLLSGRTIEGVFDGQQMIGEDGQTYVVPPNYASKSKIVTGDRLKLTITDRGDFIFKQIGPVERERVIGVLALDPETKQFLVTKDNGQWKVLAASVTFFRGEPGDEAVILIPKQGKATWAAIENLVKKTM